MATSANAKKRQFFAALVVSAAVLALPACRSSAPELTATSAYERASVGIERLRGTATVVRARMKTTLEYAVTRVAQAQEAGEFLRHSLINLGFDSDTIATSVGQMKQSAFENSPTAVVRAVDNAITPATPPTAAPLGGASPAVAVATASAQGPRLTNIVMASGVRGDDCAADVNPRFTLESSEIYVVAEAYDIPAGATIASSWQRRGAEVASFSFQPEYAINGNCIWFFIDQTDTDFVVGAWSVEITVNGQPAASPVAFQIVES